MKSPAEAAYAAFCGYKGCATSFHLSAAPADQYMVEIGSYRGFGISTRLAMFGDHKTTFNIAVHMACAGSAA